jgi:hypothetical protein
MAHTVTPQVQELLDNFAAAKKEQNELRKAHLAKKAEVRTLGMTLETLVKFGVVPQSVLDEAEEDDEQETSDES